MRKIRHLKVDRENLDLSEILFKEYNRYQTKQLYYAKRNKKKWTLIFHQQVAKALLTNFL